MANTRRARVTDKELDAIIERIQNSAPPEEWPTYGMTDEQVIEHCRKVREKLWQEKLSRHASRS